MKNSNLPSKSKNRFIGTPNQRGRQRREALPALVEIADDLPIYQIHQQITQAIRDHQVVIVAGETGSGKTTQIPKCCLNAGLGDRAQIACTQPRRIAAKTIASRVSDELNCQLGDAVGFKIRFNDKSSDSTLIKFMTDGILLAETQQDPLLKRYQCIIVDEAHERSLNIDFLLGYIKQLLPKRPDLKLIITSATIDTQRFSEHFKAPIIEVSGRGYPVDIRYRSRLTDSGDIEELADALSNAVGECWGRHPQGDILIFLSGEREIRESMLTLNRNLPYQIDIVPLFGRLSAKEQQAVFNPGPQVRIILTTNIAETSVTVPRVHYVIDAGQARISRYSHRNKVQRLPIEAISQAASNQRAGRCGRIAPGLCIRLFDEDDFKLRDEFTQPEILRTSLAAIILQMQALKLGDISNFPFLDKPAPRMINDGYQLLKELAAIDGSRKITQLGRQINKIPIDPQLARCLIEAVARDCIDDMLTIAAVLSIQSPKERPLDAQQAADEAHANFRDESSDFLGFLKIWQKWQQVVDAESQNKQRKWCQRNFLNFMRMREWRDLRQQLSDSMKDLHIPKKPSKACLSDRLHQALCAGFLSNIANYDEQGIYWGARQKKLRIFPGSALHKKRPKWILAAFQVETSQLYARTCAKIDVEWLESIGSHLVKRSHQDAFWSQRQGRVLVHEQVSLFGLSLVQNRRVAYQHIDPSDARRLFIEHALVKGELNTKRGFHLHNQKMIADIEGLEDKQRRRDLLVDKNQVYSLFNERIPDQVCSSKTLESWLKTSDLEKCLYLKREQLLVLKQDDAWVEQFPDYRMIADKKYALSYHFQPGEAIDGVTIHLELSSLNEVSEADLSWMVAGLLREKVLALLRGLPKNVRKNFVPLPEFASRCVAKLIVSNHHLSHALSELLKRMSGVDVSMSDLDETQLDRYLKMNVRIVNSKGEVIDQGRDLLQLQNKYRKMAQQDFSNNAGCWLKDGLRQWDFGELPIKVTLTNGAVAWPALVDQEPCVGIRLFESSASALGAMTHGLRRLLGCQLIDKTKYLHKQIRSRQALCLSYSIVDQPSALIHDVEVNILDSFCEDVQWQVRNLNDFNHLCKTAAVNLLERANQLLPPLEKALVAYKQITRLLNEGLFSLWPASHEDIETQLEQLFYPGFLTETPISTILHYPRYLQAIEERIKKLKIDPQRDQRQLLQLHDFWYAYLRYLDQDGDYTENVSNYRWLVEEFRVSLFAQHLGTPHPVSIKRLKQAGKKAKIVG